MKALEYNFDGLVGPTHNYAGLAPGNLASQSHKDRPSQPKAAALQGLAKMKLLHDLGVPQAVLPPQPRPDVGLLRRLGFAGDDGQVLSQAQKDAPHLLAMAWSASCMWTANAATVCPSADSADGRVHFTPANLAASLHRANETQYTAQTLRAIFHDEQHFVHHEPLPATADMGDEGAANHTRFCKAFGDPGVQLFVYGQAEASQRFRPRQSLQASQAVARLHGLNDDRTVYLQQTPEAIDAGVFHNDVIAVGHRDLLMMHESAFVDREASLERLRAAYAATSGGELRIAQVDAKDVSLEEAVATYLFNSQIVTSPESGTTLIAPKHCEASDAVRGAIETMIGRGDLDAVRYVDVHQSMDNGGGPACLRLRVVLTEAQAAALPAGVVFDDERYAALRDCVERWYPEEIRPGDLGDVGLVEQVRAALRGVMGVLGLEME